MRFPDRLLVELFRNSETLLSEARLEPEGFIFVRLKQLSGHSRTKLDSIARARVSMDTDYATIRAVESGTEFVVCQSEKLTCMVTLNGQAEVEAQGEVVGVKAGEATYIFPGQPPQPAICAPLDEINQWQDQLRSTEDVPTLGQVVASWSQTPCSETPQSAEMTPTVEAKPLPRSEGMVRIVGGRYQVGTSRPDEFHITLQPIDVGAFWIDQFEVTNAQYKPFLDQTGQAQPRDWLAGTFPTGEEGHPIKGVTWNEAYAYCDWANKRLPTEAEWEAAARGPGEEPPLYPWGPDPQAGGEARRLPLGSTYAVGAMNFNRSPFGIYDMAGNVWEWVRDPYAPVPDGHQVLRGGRHGFLKDMAYRQSGETEDERFVGFAGFRCAADRVEGE
jgi:formylglycine-generating enzyme required for sulfatase activity